MIFQNGTRKAGFFKENVLIELLTDDKAIDEVECNSPEAFKQELRLYVQKLNPVENNQHYLQKQFT